MARKQSIEGPTLRRHTRSGNAYAKFNGKQLWFGPYDERSTHSKFARFKARWEANHRQIPASALPSRKVQQEDDYTIEELVADYLEHCEIYYRRADGSQTGETANVRDSVRPLLRKPDGKPDPIAETPVSEFTPAILKAARDRMIKGGLTRSTVNARVARIVRMVGWGCDEE